MRKIFLSLCIFLLSIVGFAMQSIGKTDIKHWIQENSSINTPYKEKSQELEGMVLDEEGYAISEATLEVKQNGKVQTIQSDKYGRFQFPADYGLLNIFSQKRRFLSGREIFLVRKRPPIEKLPVVMKKKFSYFLGSVTGGIKTLSGVTVRLRNENLET